MKKAREEDMRRFIDYIDYQNGMASVTPPDKRIYDYKPALPRPEHRLIKDFAHKTEALKKEMVELARKHPSLTKAMMDEHELKQRYILEQREKFKDSIMIGHPEPEEYFGDELKFLNVAYLAHHTGMMKEEIWSYWDRKLRSVIHQEPYRSIWLSSNTETYADVFVAYVNRILSGG